MTIWKFPLTASPMFAVKMPKGARILAVDSQRSEPMCWALVDEEAPTVERRIAACGTGHEAAHVTAAQHIGTVMLAGGSFVLHFFDMGEF